MINCKACTHYHHNNDQHLCDAGVFDVRIFGKAVVEPMQEECAMSDAPVGVGKVDIPVLLDKRSKAYKDSIK